MSKLDILSKDITLDTVCKALLNAFSRSAEILRHCTNTAKKMESHNDFGDQQLAMDVQCEQILFDELKKCGEVTYVLSEETPQPIKLSDHGHWIVTFDPLDGSSIIGNNFSIGGIVAIWPHNENILIGNTGRDLASACCCLYGSRTSCLFYNQVKDCVEEYTLQSASSEYWELTKTDIKIKKSGNIFSPGNTRCIGENPPYKEIVDHWLSAGYTLRYSGGMAPDIYQIFMKEEGVFACMGTDRIPSKLRYIYEVAPLAFLVEKAGGATTTGSKPILDQKVENYVQRSQITVGCENEIKYVESVYDKWQKKIAAIHQ